VYITHNCQPRTTRLGQPRDNGKGRGMARSVSGVPVPPPGAPTASHAIASRPLPGGRSPGIRRL
jgi:hypothetical protein